MKTTLPQAPAFRAYLAGADDGARRDFTPVRYERARLAYIASTMRYPGHVADWPLEAPFGGDNPLTARLLDLRAAKWLGLIDDDLPFQHLIDDLMGSILEPLAWFDEFRFPPMVMDARTGFKHWPAGVTRRRLPAAVHREAHRLAGELSLPWHWRIIDDTPDIERLGAERGTVAAPLEFRHLVAVAALMLLNDAVDVVAAEGARLRAAFHRLAPGVRIGAGWRNDAWRDAARRLAGEELNRLKARAALHLARRLHDRALGWLDAWQLSATAERDAQERAALAVEAQIEAARTSRQVAARRGAKPRADEVRKETRSKIAAAFARLQPEQRGRFAAGTIAQALGMHPRTVRQHLEELGLRGNQRNGT